MANKRKRLYVCLATVHRIVRYCDIIVRIRVHRVSSVGIATPYGLDGPWIDCRWGGGEIFRTRQTGPGAYPASYTMGSSFFSEVKRTEHGVDHPSYLASRSSRSVRAGTVLYRSDMKRFWPVCFALQQSTSTLYEALDRLGWYTA